MTGGVGYEALRMQSKKHRNVYFAGEVINIDGITGGYNFQHAWSSGMIATRAIAKSCGF